MCRDLYRASHEGEVISKQAAARWAQQQWPKWATLIHNPLAWRDEHVERDATLPETLLFVNFGLDQCER